MDINAEGARIESPRGGVGRKFALFCRIRGLGEHYKLLRGVPVAANDFSTL